MRITNHPNLMPTTFTAGRAGRMFFKNDKPADDFEEITGSRNTVVIDPRTGSLNVIPIGTFLPDGKLFSNVDINLSAGIIVHAAEKLIQRLAQFGDEWKEYGPPTTIGVF